MAEPTLYLFDGYNLLHAGEFADPRELVDALASFVALRGVRGVVVFDGVGEDASFGPLDVRYAPDADALIERLAAERRELERVCVVSSDAAVRKTSGIVVAKLGSSAFLRGLPAAGHRELGRHEVADRVDEATRARLEQLRRGQ